jgi:hypothetical protein
MLFSLTLRTLSLSALAGTACDVERPLAPMGNPQALFLNPALECPNAYSKPFCRFSLGTPICTILRSHIPLLITTPNGAVSRHRDTQDTSNYSRK